MSDYFTNQTVDRSKYSIIATLFTLSLLCNVKIEDPFKRALMQRLINFLYYNIFVYIIYWIIDVMLDLLNLYSNHELGTDITIMPTDTDMILIGTNFIISLVLGLITLNRLKAMREV